MMFENFPLSYIVVTLIVLMKIPEIITFKSLSSQKYIALVVLLLCVVIKP